MSWKHSLGLGVVICLTVLMFRHFIAVGYLFPVRIVGDSMYPTLLGRHSHFECPHCQFTGNVSALDGHEAPRACWHCRKEDQLSCVSQSAAAVIVDRLAWRTNQCRRGDLIAFYEPGSRRLAVKRVAGLPGERLALRQGVLWIDGTPWLGPARFLVDNDRFRCDGKSLWQPTAEHTWQATARGQHLQNPNPDLEWLVWNPRADQRLDDIGFNHTLRRALHKITCVELSGKMHLQGKVGAGSVVVIRYQAGEHTWDARYDLAAEQLQLNNSQARKFNDRSFSFEFAQRPNEVRLRCGTWDLQVPTESTHLGTFAIGGAQVDLQLEGLLIRRPSFVTNDVPEPITLAEWQLKAGEYFVLGDNAVVSRDSRHYGAIPAHTILGLVRQR